MSDAAWWAVAVVVGALIVVLTCLELYGGKHR